MKKNENEDRGRDNKNIELNDNNNNMNMSDDEENDFNFDELSEEEKIALIKHRQMLLKMQEEAEARGEYFDIQEYLANLEGQDDEEDNDDFMHQNNDNKLNKSF